MLFSMSEAISLGKCFHFNKGLVVVEVVYFTTRMAGPRKALKSLRAKIGHKPLERASHRRLIKLRALFSTTTSIPMATHVTPL